MKNAARPDPDRLTALGVLARASADELASALEHLAFHDAVVDLKPSEVGLVMLRGRIGGDGQAFNVGEATVARAVVQLPSGHVGYGHRLGRDVKSARNAAILDALWQDNTKRRAVESAVIEPVRQRLNAERDLSAKRAAATRVEFFTVARERS